MDGKKLEALAAAVELGSFTRAAEQLGYTQSGLTHMMNSLEREIGFSVLARDRRGVRLTPAGQRIMPIVQQCLAANRALEREIAMVSARQEETIRVASYASIAMHWLPELIEQFRRQHSGVSVDVQMGSVEEVYRWVREGKVDMAFASRQESSTLDWTPLKPDPLLVILPRDFDTGGGGSLDVRRLEGQEFLMPSLGFHLDIMRVLERCGVTPVIRDTQVSDTVIISMVEHGLGVSILSRLVLKGQAEVCVLYRGENQELAAYRTALPFSQLLDGVELPEGAETEARIQWASSEIRVLRTENGPAFGITVTICAALLVRRKQQVSYIEDLYSLHHAAQVRRQETPLPVAWQRDIPSQEAVQQLEFGQGRPFAYLTAAECSGVSTVQEGGGPALRCTVRLRVLYLDESGTPVCAERSAEVTAPAAWEPQTVRAACGLPQMQITGSTCRLSVPVRFEARRCLRRPVAAVTAVELQDPPEGPQPSLILRRMAEGETLWDIARQYRTDEEAIRAANELTEDRPEGMLLIPRVR